VRKPLTFNKVSGLRIFYVNSIVIYEEERAIMSMKENNVQMEVCFLGSEESRMEMEGFDHKAH
jgi:hypothetical protein